ncbi:hypothetical protein GCM10009563_20540 [Subtercola frigoramans]
MQAALAKQKPQSTPPQSLRTRHIVIDQRFGDFTNYSVRPRRENPAASSGMHPDVQPPQRRAVLYLHGGAYVNGMAPQHWSLVSQMVDAGLRVDVSDYGLAPRYTHRDAYPFVTEVYRALLDEEGSQNVTIVGDSAGGALALGLAQTFRATPAPTPTPTPTPRPGQVPARVHPPMPRQLLLISPWLDLTLTNPEIDEFHRHDPWLSAVALREEGLAWAGGDDPTDPRLSPISGSLQGLPPTHIYIGTRDILYPDVQVLHERSGRVDWHVTVDVCPGAVHVYPLVPAPEGRRAARDIVARCVHG